VADVTLEPCGDTRAHQVDQQRGGCVLRVVGEGNEMGAPSGRSDIMRAGISRSARTLVQVVDPQSPLFIGFAISRPVREDLCDIDATEMRDRRPSAAWCGRCPRVTIHGNHPPLR